jgi:hypothetical protein
MPLSKPLQKPGPPSETAFLSFLKGTSVGEWLFGFPEGTKRVAGRWRSRATPGLPEKSDAPREGVPEGWMQTVRPSATPRLCHPSGVRALFGPVSGGVSTHRLQAGFPPGTWPVAVWVPEGNKESSRAVATPPVCRKKSDAPRKGVPEGWNANGAFVSNPTPLSPLRGEGPFGARIRWWRKAPPTGYRLGSLREPEGCTNASGISSGSRREPSG